MLDDVDGAIDIGNTPKVAGESSEEKPDGDVTLSSGFIAFVSVRKYCEGGGCVSPALVRESIAAE